MSLQTRSQTRASNESSDWNQASAAASGDSGPGLVFPIFVDSNGHISLQLWATILLSVALTLKIAECVALRFHSGEVRGGVLIICVPLWVVSSVLAVSSMWRELGKMLQSDAAGGSTSGCGATRKTVAAESPLAASDAAGGEDAGGTLSAEDAVLVSKTTKDDDIVTIENEEDASISCEGRDSDSTVSGWVCSFFSPEDDVHFGKQEDDWICVEGSVENHPTCGHWQRKTR